MRPAGEARQALAEAARKLERQRLHSAQRGATWRDLAEHARVGYTLAKTTVRNMQRAGELQRLPQNAATSHSRRPMALYAPAAPAAAPAPPHARSPAFDGTAPAWCAGLTR